MITPVPFPPEVGYVYAMINEAFPGMVKIGKTGNVRNRFSNYDTGDPLRGYTLIAHTDPTVGVGELETWVHEHYGEHRVAPKSEWFRLDWASVVGYFARLNDSARR